MDRKPKPAPFAVGTRLRYTGTMEFVTTDGQPILRQGDERVVARTNPGRQGTLRWIDMDDGEEPIQDTTRDGYSVVENAGYGAKFGRVVDPDKWEAV